MIFRSLKAYIILNSCFLFGNFECILYEIIIDTNRGQKSITLIREGITFNLFTAIQKGSKFFQLSLGDNFFSYLVDEGSSDASVHIVFKYYTLYRGV